MRRSKSAEGIKDKLATLRAEADTFKQQRDELNFLITSFYSEDQLHFDDATPIPADKALRVFTKWKVQQK